ncbi:TrbI/VirB10 family protein [Blastomonas sp. AAP53]|uniref:TrbI/VirB10 family protein n=1 Tax=Blastomonas sp. AAP53 TaxID=1248760 RepID=UPI00035F45B0|nr:TrbI/VirB10 family protein [Blastomonas sp. AAP53]
MIDSVNVPGQAGSGDPAAVVPELPTAEQCRPQVALPSAGVPTWALVLASVAIGSAVMLTLNGQRGDQAAAASARSYGASPAPPLPSSLEGGLDIIGSPMPGTDPVMVRVEPPYRAGSPAFSQPTSPPRGGANGGGAFASRMPPAGPSSEGSGFAGGFRSEPMPGAPGSPAGAQMRTAGPPGSSVVFDAGTGGANDEKLSGENAPVRASLIRNRPALVAQGEIISATLETPVNSERPGLIRAIVSRDVRSFDGSRVLIPKGSRLIGEFRADQQVGKRRVLATWNRLIRPDGVAIKLDSPVADASGSMGIPGKVDTHFLARFANAALQTALQIGVNRANRNGNNVIVSGTGQMPGMVSQAIIPNADLPPTVRVQAGTSISVFTARDLDFSGVPLVR